MATINRFRYLYSEQYSAAYGDSAWGFDFVHLFKAKQKRENCVIGLEHSPQRL